jgi:hypothetical protein
MRTLALAAVILSLTLPGLAHAEAGCAVPPALALPNLKLPHARSLVHARHTLVVLAVGSAPTLGAAADGAAFSYPSRLEVRLSALLPGVAVAVLNQGAAHRSTQSMARHLSEMVAESGARLVLWETGGREVSRGMNVDSYASEVQLGLDEIQSAGADAILLDLQYTPGMMRLAPIDAYRQVIHDAAANSGVAVFQRYELMIDWAQHGLTLNPTDSAARVPAARRLYDCIAAALAQAIAPAVR